MLHDPYVRDFDLPFTKDFNEVIRDADALVIVTKHKEYLNLDLSSIKHKMNTSVIIDGRNIYQKEECEKAGFIFKGVGKPR